MKRNNDIHSSFHDKLKEIENNIQNQRNHTVVAPSAAAGLSGDAAKKLKDLEKRVEILE